MMPTTCPSRLRTRTIASVFMLLVVPSTMGLISGSLAFGADTAVQQGSPPNVVLIVTDDQGYGDIAAHGNPLLKTPNLDSLYRASVRLTDFHVDPTCSPTRAALMSGRYSTKAGVWHTISGRSMMATEETTMAERFRAAGYRTGMFGKWHLGDAFPTRPQDQGFQVALYHGGGGVGQTPDYWGNDYFDDTYWRNGKVESFTGYCTDVWFQQSQKFVDAQDTRPFFLYLATNAPHGPYHVPDSYRQPYVEAGDPTDRFLGMLANIDENVGKLVEHLKTTDRWENTIFIFMTDNGTAQGSDVFNAGMRGKKGSEYDGGHRVPCFWHWPAGQIAGGRDVDALTAHIDLVPTLTELCDLPPLPGPVLDGISLASLLRGESVDAKQDRTLIVHSQRIMQPKKWRKSSVMTTRWRLVNGEQLFDITLDPGQKADVATENADVVAKLRAQYDAWWQSLSPSMSRTVHYQLGDPAQPVVELTAHDWLSASVPWNQSMIKKGPPRNGAWAVEVRRAGRYEIELSRWPQHLRRPIDATQVKLTIQGKSIEQKIDPKTDVAKFQVELTTGESRLQSFLTSTDGSKRGAYYATIRRLQDAP